MSRAENFHEIWKKIKYKISKLVVFVYNIPVLIKCHDVIPYLTNRANRVVMNVFIKDIRNMKGKKEDFRKRYREIHQQYDKIIFDVYPMRHIGEMCQTYYLWHIENRGKDNLLYVMAPVLLSDSYDMIPNRYFFDRIQDRMKIIQQDNYEFWCWMLRHHKKEIEFSSKYSFNEMMKREMDYVDFNENCFQVSLNPKEQEIFDQMKIRDEFICIFNRDTAYHQARKGIKVAKSIISPSNEARNSSVKDYELLAREFNSKGISLVRMGYHVEESAEMDGVIDYASKYRTEVLDFYLISRCKFFMVSNSGIILIAKLFTTPLVVVNAAILSFGADTVAPMSPQKDLILLKKFWYPKQNRYLSLDEILYMEGTYKTYGLFAAYRSIGIVFHSNSQEELLDIAEEMRDRLEGKLIYTDEDEKLQEQYRAILEKHVKSNGNHYFNGRYSAAFLRQNPWFLKDIDEEKSIKNIL